MHVWFWWGGQSGRDHLEDLSVDRRIIMKRILKKEGERVWIGWIWLRIETSCGLF